MSFTPPMAPLKPPTPKRIGILAKKISLRCKFDDEQLFTSRKLLGEMI